MHFIMVIIQIKVCKNNNNKNEQPNEKVGSKTLMNFSQKKIHRMANKHMQKYILNHIIIRNCELNSLKYYHTPNANIFVWNV